METTQDAHLDSKFVGEVLYTLNSVMYTSINSLFHVYINEFWLNITEFIASCHT